MLGYAPAHSWRDSQQLLTPSDSGATKVDRATLLSLGSRGTEPAYVIGEPPVAPSTSRGHVARLPRRQEHVERRQLGRLRRPAQRRLRPKSPSLSSGIVAGISGVHTGPGATELTRMPFSASCAASPLVNVTIAALGRGVVEQVRRRAERLHRRRGDDADDPAGMCGTAALHSQNSAYTLVFITRSNCSVVISSSPPGADIW